MGLIFCQIKLKFSAFHWWLAVECWLHNNTTKSHCFCSAIGFFLFEQVQWNVFTQTDIEQWLQIDRNVQNFHHQTPIVLNAFLMEITHLLHGHHTKSNTRNFSNYSTIHTTNWKRNLFFCCARWQCINVIVSQRWFDTRIRTPNTYKRTYKTMTVRATERESVCACMWTGAFLHMHKYGGRFECISLRICDSIRKFKERLLTNQRRFIFIRFVFVSTSNQINKPNTHLHTYIWKCQLMVQHTNCSYCT